MNKNKEIVIGVVALIIVVAIWWLMVGRNEAEKADEYTTSLAPAAAVTPAAAPSVTPAPTPTPQPAAPAPQANAAHVIDYTDAGFSPSTLTVKAGGTVTFKNDSSADFWPASNPHPIHTGYPVTGGCIGSTFDACRAVPPGGSWSFTFTIRGTWGFHNHLSPSFGGVVIVE